MKKFALLIILLFSINICKSQQQTAFFNMFGVGSDSWFGWIYGFQTLDGKYSVFDFSRWDMSGCYYSNISFDTNGKTSTPIYPWEKICRGQQYGNINYLSNGDLFLYGGEADWVCNNFFDKNGKLLWSQDSEASFINNLYVTKDSNIVGLFRTCQYITELICTNYIAKATTAGQIIWKTRFDSIAPRYSNIIGYSDKHGSLYVFASTYQYSCKIRVNGQKEW